MSDKFIDNSENTAEITITQQTHEPHKWTDEEINTIKNTVAKDATDEELKMFLSLASAHGLNPFQHEIWFVKMGDKNVIITARDGYLKIAQNSPHFLGLESDVVYAGDKFLKDKDGIHHSYTLSNRGAIIGAYAMVYRDDRTVPAYFFAPFSNYNRRGGVWLQYPHAMIIKVAESMALKRAFAINGLVTQEEIGYDGNKQILSAAQQANFKQRERNTQLRQLWSRYQEVCGNPIHAKNAMKKVTGKDASKDYTDDDINALFEDVIRREDELINAQVLEREQRESAEQDTHDENIETEYQEEQE